MMRNLAAVILAGILTAILVPSSATPADYSPVTTFDPSRNPESDLRAAMDEARQTGKRVLLDVGGEWCKWCHIMDRFIENDSDLRGLLESNYVLLKINFSEKNENKRFLSRFPAISGYPHLFVLDASGKLIHSQSTAPLEQGSSYDERRFADFLKRWAPPESGFVALFDGSTLNGWTLMGGVGSGYLARDGMIICPADGGGNLFTEKEYSNFILRFEFKLEPGGNNGIGVRAPLEGDAAYVGMEVQILDNENPQYKDLRPAQYHGSVYDVFPAKRGFLKKPDEWNIEEISAVNRRISVTLNGTVILDVDLDSMKDPEVLKKHPGLARKSGHIGFLGHHAYMEFRNIRLKELP